ncbi:MAG: ParB/RepB/Spo0J family partition protein [Blautia massiliensis (ex Durand et al. 2017)]
MMKKVSPAYRASKEETIPINKLHPFSNHPFHVRHDLEFSELVDSISESGIITPITVRPKVGVGYEVISGHRRWEACKELGIESIPARVEYIDDDEATILMVNSNIQREHVLPSEKAFAYKMRMEALKRTAGRPSKNSCQVGTNFRADKTVAESTSESARTVQRYIRLTNLIPSILQMVDDGRIAFNPAVEISYMTEEHQTWLKEEMDMCDATPSLVQSRTLKDMSRNGTLTENYLHTLLTEEKPNQRQKFFLNQSDVQRYFPYSKAIYYSQKCGEYCGYVATIVGATNHSEKSKERES